MSIIFIYILAMVFLVAIFVVSLLYIFKVWPFNSVPNYKNPRTWANDTNQYSWTQRTYDYGNNSRNVPDPMIKDIYCAYDATRCISNLSTFNASSPPTGSC